ncbi:phage head closure protein [Listeria monocytogenes]
MELRLDSGRVTFNKKVTTKGNNGQPKILLQEVLSCWFSYKFQSLRERKDDIGNKLEDTTDIYIRQQQKEAILNNYVAEIGGTKYEIIAIAPDRTYKTYMAISLKEVK